MCRWFLFWLMLSSAVLSLHSAKAQQAANIRQCFGQVSVTYFSESECAWIEGQTVQMLQKRDAAQGLECKSAYRFSRQPFKLLDRVPIDLLLNNVRRQRLFIANLSRCNWVSLVFVGVIIDQGKAPEIGLLDWQQVSQTIMARSRQLERERLPFDQLSAQIARDIAYQKAQNSRQRPALASPHKVAAFADLPIWRAADMVNFVLKNFWDLTPDYWLLASNYMLFTEPEKAMAAYVYADMAVRYTARRCAIGGESRVEALRQTWSLPQWLGQHVTDYAKALQSEVVRSGTSPLILPTAWACEPRQPGGQFLRRETDPVHPPHLWQRIWLDLMEDMSRDATILLQAPQGRESFARILPPPH